jgi:hypothetical protein
MYSVVFLKIPRYTPHAKEASLKINRSMID